MFGTIDMGNIFEAKGLLRLGEKEEPISIVVSAPKPSFDDSEYSCLVHAPPLLSEDKEIYGIDEEQAAELALKFLRSLLRGRGIVDENGQPVALPTK